MMLADPAKKRPWRQLRQAATLEHVRRTIRRWREHTTTPPSVLAFDPSSTRTGYAYFDGPDVRPECGLIRPVEGGIGARARSIYDDAAAAIAEHSPELVLVEAPSGKVARRLAGHGAGLSLYGFAVGVVAGAAMSSANPDCDVLLIDEPLWTRNQRKTTRRASVELSVPTYCEIRDQDSGMDIADAIGLGLWFYGEYARATRMERTTE
ncbi:MAG: hypothetical protein U0990_09735 [Candidatus Nanopelagicales bacterium]|nr:hypothetical protein [Candidatus Nanopelagicales bacterium]